MSLVIRDMKEEDEYYVGTCTHVNENNIEREESCRRRIAWLKSMERHGTQGSSRKKLFPCKST